MSLVEDKKKKQKKTETYHGNRKADATPIPAAAATM